MNKDRLAAFTDAILAIIMTILVLELKKPDEATWAALWALRSDFLSYAVSFFWLGAMWVNIHAQWSRIEKINNKVVWWSIIMLFFASFFPYVTSFVSEHFTSLFAHMFYSVIVILVSIANMALGHEVIKENGEEHALSYSSRIIIAADLGIKAVGILLAILFYPPLAMFGIILAGIVVTFVPAIVNQRRA
ncbi:MAG: DUF1211 domain-containing protein [Ruminococcus sp.]|nr:DUF1211 domain-containing protein [Ruminococcus sp.]